MTGPSTQSKQPAGAPDPRPGAGVAPDGLPEVLGQYQLLSRMGQGGMGEVYKALHVRLKREVAIKFLHGRRRDAHALERFRHEMEALGRLDHPHVVRATDAADWQGRPY